MNITLREMGDELKKLNRIVVTGHVNPDGDAVGSALALAAILKQLGKDVRVVFNDDMPRNFSILPYRSEIEKPPANGEKIPADALVIVDASPDRIGRVLECVDAPILNIDHHVSNDGEGRKLYCDPDSAATAEIIFKLGMDLNVELTKEIAACIYVGIATDSGFFCYSNTTPRTLWIASKLLEVGVRPNVISEVLEERPLAVIVGLGEALRTLELWHDGKAAGIFLDRELTSKLETTEGFIDQIRVIEGVDVALMLKCTGENVCRVSMRSKNVDVTKIALQFDGGGHIRAAGCTLKMPFDEAKKAIVDAIDRELS